MESHSVGVGFIKLLLVLVMMWQNSATVILGMEHQFLGSDNSNSTSSPSSVLLELSYPNVKIGPYNWRYFRVDVPQAFAKFTVAFTRKWTGEHIGDRSTKVPLVCFRYGALPSPDTILDSLEAAAIAAGKAQNVAETGTCAWFHDSSSVVLSNMQIAGGVWYIGVFSDTQPSRYQSKMISRGSIFIFGIQMTVFGCKSPNFIGRDCNSSVTQLCTQEAASSHSNFFRNSHFNSREIRGNLEPASAENDLEIKNGASNWVSGVDDESWRSLKLQRVAPGAWAYFSLEIADYFPAKLEICAECTNSSSCGREEEVAKLYLKFGRLPNEGDEFSVVSGASPPVSVPVPRRGRWFIGVRGNSNLTMVLEFSLLWRVLSCPFGMVGENCTSMVKSLERVLMEDTYESPFDSYYTPASKGGYSHPPWFPLQPNNPNPRNSGHVSWTYLYATVPRGAAGGVLSIELRHVAPPAVAALYARFEGVPTQQLWDSKASQQTSESTAVSLNLLYPAEGVWCIGVQVSQDQGGGGGGLSSQVVGGSVPRHRQVALKLRHLWSDVAGAFLSWHRRMVTWINSPPFRKFRNPGTAGGCENSICSQPGGGFGPSSSGSYSYSSSFGSIEIPNDDNYRKMSLEVYNDAATLQFASEATKKSIDRNVSSGNQTVSKRQEPELRISIHGCVNRCSGRGKCLTTYESSRLYFYSFCHCDTAHGGVDCSVRLIVRVEEILHIWALIGSNFAALLPSVWAVRHHAYSEWVSYSASGVASAVYHSCDAGGWCALSYDTLQFLDFWLAYFVVVVTCLYMVPFKQSTKAVAHLGVAIITAAAIKEDATSAWNLLLVVLMGVACLVLGWALASCKRESIPTWLRTLRPLWRSLRFNYLYRRGQLLMRQLHARFRWFYLTTGLSILVAAAMSWALETDTTYWLWHSLWHLSIYTSAFLILCSTTKAPWPSEEEATVFQEPSDMENLPMLRHTVELDEFAIDS